MKHFVCAFLIVVAFTFVLAQFSRADECGKDAAAAIAAARDALEANDAKQDHRALECLVQAVQDIQKQVDLSSNGAAPVRAKSIRLFVEREAK